MSARPVSRRRSLHLERNMSDEGTMPLPQWRYERPEEPYAGDEQRPDPRLERELLLDALRRRDIEDEQDAA